MVKAVEEKLKQQKIFRIIWDYMIITVFSLTYAVGISLFLDPNNLAPGGVSGISIMLSRITPLPTGTWIILLNIPILALGLWKFGLKFLISTIYCTMISSVFMNILSGFGALTSDKLLAALAGGTIMAVSLGMIFKAGATTGGVDIIIKVLRLKYKHLKTGNLYLLMDAAVVTLSGIMFNNLEIALYAAVTIFVNSVVLDTVLYGRDGAKMIYIISDYPKQITDRLLADLDIGVTSLHGEGAYSGKEKEVLMCVMRKPLAPKAQQIVREEDAEAFMIVSDATEIFGEGYKSYFGERL
ncbi:MAG: YitT family protein [Lachnospiraceae bacterium]|nr:YitT family protein [Lachnospiraceae bacterium]